MKELNIRVEELEAELDKLLTQQHDADEELKSRVARLETLSFIDSLTQLIQQAEKRGLDPTQLLQKALQTLTQWNS